MDKKNTAYYNSMTILVILFLVIMAGLNTVKSHKVFSETENRRLEQRPDFSIKQLLKGNFTSDFEKYISDQFAFRDFWIEVNSNMVLFSGKNENNDVYSGKTGYLIQKFNAPDKNELDEKLKAINVFADSTPEINKYFMLVPNSVEVLEEKLPSQTPAVWKHNSTSRGSVKVTASSGFWLGGSEAAMVPVTAPSDSQARSIT